MISWNTYIHFLLSNKLARLRSRYEYLKLMKNTNKAEYKLYTSIKRCMLEIANDPTSEYA